MAWWRAPPSPAQKHTFKTNMFLWRILVSFGSHKWLCHHYNMIDASQRVRDAENYSVELSMLTQLNANGSLSFCRQILQVLCGSELRVHHQMGMRKSQTATCYFLSTLEILKYDKEIRNTHMRIRIFVYVCVYTDMYSHMYIRKHKTYYINIHVL